MSNECCHGRFGVDEDVECSTTYEAIEAIKDGERKRIAGLLRGNLQSLGVGGPVADTTLAIARWLERGADPYLSADVS